MFDSYFLNLLVYTVPILAVGIVGLIFGFRVRSRNNSAGLLTIVGWGMVVFRLIMIKLLQFLLFGSRGLSTDNTDNEMMMQLYSFGSLISLLIYPVALGCILLGILRLASSGSTATGSRASSVRYQPLDLHATGDR
jgi:hypothetical protein